MALLRLSNTFGSILLFHLLFVNAIPSLLSITAQYTTPLPPSPKSQCVNPNVARRTKKSKRNCPAKNKAALPPPGNAQRFFKYCGDSVNKPTYKQESFGILFLWFFFAFFFLTQKRTLIYWLCVWAAAHLRSPFFLDCLGRLNTYSLACTAKKNQKKVTAKIKVHRRTRSPWTSRVFFYPSSFLSN